MISAISGTPIPVDPGGHDIEATAPGKKPWRSIVDVTKSMAPILLPKLEDEPTEAPAAPEPAAQSAAPEAGSNVAGCEGAPLILAHALKSPLGLSVDDNYLYFASRGTGTDRDGSVMKVVKP